MPSPRTPLAMDDLHETGENSCSPHVQKEDLNCRRVRVTHRTETNHTASLGDHPDQKRLATASGKFLLEKIQPRVKDLTMSISPPKIHQHPPFFIGQHLKITTCTSTGSSTGRNKTPTTKRLGDKNHSCPKGQGECSSCTN